MRGSKTFIAISTLFMSCYSNAYCKENSYKLISTNDTLVDGYYIFTFLYSTDTLYVLSKKQLKELEGCWNFLEVNKKYKLTLSKAYLNDLVLPPLGYTVSDKNNNVIIEFKKPGETFFKAEEINGKLYRGK